ncbi:MAG: hypothetical protein M3Y87_18020 [Myxococcota bacterium]|nr:hypothetical protein [Myxococcota bacterium]
MTNRISVIGLALAVALGSACGSAEERDGSRGGPYDACDVGAAECPASTEGCAGVVVDYVDYRTAERMMCSSECTSDAECPADPPGLGGACIAFEGTTTGLCYRRCTRDEECPADFGCIDRLPAADGGDSFFDPICLPIR